MSALDPRACAPLLLVEDLAAARAFWCGVLGLELVEGDDELCRVRAGEQSLFLWSKTAAHEVLPRTPGARAGDAGCVFLEGTAFPPGDPRRHLGPHRRQALSERLECLVQDPDGHRVLVPLTDDHGSG